MRIGIFSDTYPPFVNGVSTSIIVLKKYLEKLGHQVYVVTVNNEKFNYKIEENGKVIKVPGIAVGIYDYRLTSIYPLKIIKKIKSWNLDVIHSQTEFGIGTFARIISKQLNIPIVHTYHTMYEDYIDAVTKGHFQNTGKTLVEYFTDFYCDKTITELIVPTKKTYDLFKEKYKYDRNVHIIPNGIDLEKYYKENCDKTKIKLIKKELGILPEDFVILYVGRLGQEKNVFLQFNAMAKLAKKYPNCKMVYVGDGPEFNKLKEKTKKEHLENNVLFTGKVPLTDVANYYQIANIFTTASRFETQGLTVVEALAGSIPVLCVRDDSFTPIVVPGLNGDLFDDEKGFIKYVEKYLKNPEILEKYVKQAKNSALSSSGEFFAQKALKVYKQAIKNNGTKTKSFTGKLIKNIKETLKWKK